MGHCYIYLILDKIKREKMEIKTCNSHEKEKIAL